MAESTLTLGWPELKAEVAFYLGYSRDSGEWAAKEITEIEALVQAGYRQFLNPPGLGDAPPWEWAFLKPVTTIDTAADDYDYDLPDDFGSIDGDLTFASDDAAYEPVRVIGEGQVRTYRMSGAATQDGVPRRAAIRPKSSDQTAGQRWELILWPTPDAVYTLTYRYFVLTNKLSDAAPYPLGSMAHSETVLASCIDKAALMMDDEKGPRRQEFMERLQSSIAHDRRAGQEFFGYNADNSELRRFSKYYKQVTYNGQTYP